MSTIVTITRDVYDSFGGNLEARVAAFRQALVDHANTEGVPAPVEDDVVMCLARMGDIEIVAAEPAPTPEQPAPPARRVITPRDFRLRFTLAERGAITLAASTALAVGDPTLQVWLDDLSASTEVDLDHPEIAAGLDAVVAAGLITSERRTAILA